MKLIRRMLCIACLLAVIIGCLIFHASAADVVASGYCGGEGDGTNLSWKLTTDRKLRIYGTGEMKNYSSYSNENNEAPWKQYWARVQMQSVIIEDGVTTIGSAAFYGLGTLERASIPDSVYSIGEKAFEHCNLGEFVVPDSVVFIGDDALNTANLTEVVFGDGLASLGGALGFNSTLEKVTIGKNIAQIDKYAFAGCDGLTEIKVSDGNLFYTDLDGVLFNKEKTHIVCFPSGKSDATYTIPRGVTTIDSYAFEESKNLTEVIIPQGLVTIGSYAFSKCKGLAQIDLPDSVVEIEDEAFSSCSNLSDISFGNSLNIIGVQAFAWCTKLQKVIIPDSVHEIKQGAFYGCKALIGAYFEGNAPKVFCNEIWYQRAFPVSIILYYTPGTSGWTDSEYYDDTAGTWKDNPLWPWTTRTDLQVSMRKDGELYNLLKERPLAEKSDTVDILVTVDWKDCTPGTISLVQNGKEVLSSEDGNFSDITLGENFVAGSSVYVSVKDDDGTEVVRRKLGLTVELDEEQKALIAHREKYYALPVERRFRVTAAYTKRPYPARSEVTVGNNVFRCDGGSEYLPYETVMADVPKGYSGDITISMDGYHDCVLSYDLVMQDNGVKLFPETMTAPFVQALILDKSSSGYAMGTNLLTDSEYFYQFLPTDTKTPKILKLYPLVNWNGHEPGNVWIEQDGIEVYLSANKYNEIDWTDYFFQPGKTFYICTRSDDGSETRMPLNIKINTRTSDIKLDLGDSMEMDTGESDNSKLDILGMQKLEFKLEDIAPVNLKVSVEGDGTIKGVIGLNLANESYSEAAFGEVKETIQKLKSVDRTQANRDIADYLKQLEKEGIKPSSSHGKFGVDGKFQYLGYLTGQYKDGKVSFKEIELVLLISGEISYAYNTTIMVVTVPVPAYFKVSLETKLGAYMKMQYDAEEKKLQAQPDEFKGSLSLSAEAGPGWEGYASGGVQGEGIINMKSSLPIEKQNTALSLQVNLKFVGSLLGISGEWQFFETKERVFWRGGLWCWENPVASRTSMFMLQDNAQFTPDLTRSVMLQSSADDTIITGISGYTAPDMQTLADGRIMAVWIADSSNRESVDKNAVYFSICANGQWSEPIAVCDDGTADALPQLYEADGVVSVAWKNQSAQYGDTMPELETLQNNLKIVTAVFDGEANTWSTPEETTPEWYLTEPVTPDDYEGDMPTSSLHRQYFTGDFRRAVIYGATDEAGINQLWGLFHDGFVWGEPVQLTNELQDIRGFDAEFHDDELALLYICGDVSAAELKTGRKSFSTDLMVSKADYLSQTFCAGNEMTISVTVKNESVQSVEGVRVTISGENAETYTEDVAIRLESGEEDILYINYQLPEAISFDQLEVSVLPLSDADANEANNSAICEFFMKDLSLENPIAVVQNGQTALQVQLVNRGQREAGGSTLVVRKDAPDGEIIAVQEIQTLPIGELEDVTLLLSGLTEEDLLYIELEELDGENLLGNNTTQVVVQSGDEEIVSYSLQAKKETDKLLITLTASNDTMQTIQNAYVIVAVYDIETGKQYACNVIEGVTVESCGQHNSEFELKNNGYGDELLCKVFMLNEKHIPLQQEGTAIISLQQ